MEQTRDGHYLALQEIEKSISDDMPPITRVKINILVAGVSAYCPSNDLQAIPANQDEPVVIGVRTCLDHACLSEGANSWVELRQRNVEHLCYFFLS